MAFEFNFGGSDTDTSVRTTELDPQTEAMRGTLWDLGIDLAKRPFPAYPGPRIAGFTPAQIEAMNLIKGGTGTWKKPFDTAALMAEGVGAYNPADAPIRQVGAAPGVAGVDARRMDPITPIDITRIPGFAELMGMATGRTGTWDTAARAKYMNPLKDAYTTEINRQGDIARSRIGLQKNAQRAFGGSGHALQEAELDSTLTRERRLAEADAWDKAFSMYDRDTARTQAMAQALAALGMQGELANLGTRERTATSNLTAGMTADQLNASIAAGNRDALNAVMARNLEAAIGTDRFNITNDVNQQARVLQAAQMLRDLGIDAQSLTAKDFQALMGVGNVEQGMDQANLDLAKKDFDTEWNYPNEVLNMLLSIMRGTPYTSTVTTEGPGGSSSAQILGSLLAAYGLLK